MKEIQLAASPIGFEFYLKNGWRKVKDIIIDHYGIGFEDINGKELQKKYKMTEKKTPTVETQMLIRKPVSTVFQAFLDPKITTNFWFTKSSGPLEVGKKVIWEWEMYGYSTTVLVKEIIVNRKILIEWGDPVTFVEYEFTSMKDDTTYVVIKNYGFKETGDQLIQAIGDNAGGFTTVLDGLKAYLEHNINLNLIADKFPNK